jgi:predicted nucleic acid-binding protein
VILTDAGPLIALINRNDTHHGVCTSVTRQMPATQLLTTWPCFTEAMHILGNSGGHRFQRALWIMRATNSLVIHDLSADEVGRMEILMEKYRDTPMDLGDASLIAVAETRSARKIFTLDDDFRVYRLANGAALEMIPSPRT